MDEGQIVLAVDRYDAILAARGYLVQKHEGVGIKPRNKKVWLSHIRWMCQDVRRMLARRDSHRYMDKCFRWLGFLQGVMYEQGLVTVESLWTDNAPYQGQED